MRGQEELLTMQQMIDSYGRTNLFVHMRGKDRILTQPEEAIAVATSTTDGRIDFDSLGDMLSYLRETYGERTGHSGQDLPKVRLTALSLISCLTKHGYPITSGAYSLLEQGKTLPKHPDRFFEAVCKCLAIEGTDKYWTLLRYQYMYDMMLRSVSREFADRYAPRGQKALDLAQSRQTV